MDKNFIHIDDLVRQRLGGSEEQEKPGAWLNMRDLLDQKMPVSPPRGGYNWRRMFGVVAGLVFLTTATLGTYHVISTTSFRNSGEQGIANAGSGPSLGNSASNGRKESSANIPATDIIEEQYSSGDAGSFGSNTSSIVSTASPVAANIEASGKSKGIGFELSKRVGLTSHSEQSNSPLYASAEKFVPVERRTAGHIISSKLATSIAKPIAAPGMKTINLAESVSESQSSNGPKSMGEVSSVSSGDIPTAGNGVAVVRNTTVKNELKKDTFRQMQIVRRYIINPLTRTSRLVIDTVSYGRMITENLALAAAVRDGIGAETANPIVAGAESNIDQALVKAGIGSNLVLLSSQKVRSRRTNAWDAQRFQDVVRDIKFNLSQVKFYPGLVVGYNNYLLKNTTFNGFHLGVSGLFTFGEQWGMMTELKYFQRANKDFALYDNYYVPVGNLYSKVEHFFKFSSIQSIEMPVAIRYTANRLNIFTGPNFGYNFNINPEKIEQGGYQAEPLNYSVPLAPSIFLDDFRQRFSVGGLLGLSYAVTPALQLDLRATKNFWDNAKGAGAEKISRELFRPYSFQISMGYRFSQKNRIPKAR